MSSQKHALSKNKLNERKGMEAYLTSSLKTYDQHVHPKGESLPVEQRVYRVKVIKTFMRAGVPISKLEYFRDLPKENALRLTERSHMLDLVPFVLGEEKSLIKEEIKNKDMSIIYDGTTRLGEVLAIVIRYIDGWNIHQRLVCLQFLAKSMTGEELARQLISTLSATYGVQSNTILATMRDGASVNNVALCVFKVIHPNIMDVRCFSHTLDIVGNKFKTPLLATFSSYWISLFSHSPRTKMLWKDYTGQAMASYSKTRWWSKWEIFHQLMVQFGDLEPFLSAHPEIGPTLRSKLLDILHDPNQLGQLKMEVAAVVDVGEHFVKTTYRLEGDGALMVNCYEEIAKLQASQLYCKVYRCKSSKYFAVVEKQ